MSLAREEDNMDAAICAYDPRVELSFGMSLLKDNPEAISAAQLTVGSLLVEYLLEIKATQEDSLLSYLRGRPAHSNCSQLHLSQLPRSPVAP